MSDGLLDMVDDPAHVKNLSLEQLEQLGGEIRGELLEKLSKSGGHLGSNLGVVELTLALHFCFETPQDRLLWDVSHQTYVHKLLTGRKDRFATIRTTGGLNGFALRAESEHDCYGAAHAGTALSAALGFAAARDKLGGDGHVVAVFGDAALTNGITYEAINNISGTTRRFIGILNDNEMSIARNVGAISGYLNKLLMNPAYSRAQNSFSRLVKWLPKGELAVRLGRWSEDFLKARVSSLALRSQEDPGTEEKRPGGLIFEEMGLCYLGPFDGHDLPTLIAALEYAKAAEEPIILHVVTRKGHGFEAAVAHPEKLHGVGPFDARTGASTRKKGGVPAWQDVFGRAMVRLCRQDPRAIGITAAMPSGTGLKLLEQEMPDRYYDVGIAEEHAVLFACGLAAGGLRPVCAIYSTFLQRAYDCIIHDAALQSLPVTFCMDRAGLSPQDGPTHHGMFDISYLRCVPGVMVMAPKDEDELVDMLFMANGASCPAFIRYPRGAAEGVAIKESPAPLEPGAAEVVREFPGGDGARVALFGLGNFHPVAMALAEELREHDVAVVNPRFVKPLDEEVHLRFGESADLVVTLEDHVIPGGYGSAVLELFSLKGVGVPVLRIGWPDSFVEHASGVGDLRERYGLTVPAIAGRIREAAACGPSAGASCLQGASAA